MSDYCGTTTEEGNAVCIPGQCSCSTESKKDGPAPLLPLDSDEPALVTKLKKVFSFNKKQEAQHVEENS